MPKPTAPEVVPAEDVGIPSSYPPTVTPTPSVPKIPSYDLEPLESDVILTFSQTIERVQSQGGRDMSRYPAVSELFDKANGLRPKLAMSLDDTGRKERGCSFHFSMFNHSKFALVAFQSQNSCPKCMKSCRKLSNSTINYSLIRSLTRLGGVPPQNRVAHRHFRLDRRMPQMGMHSLKDQTSTITGPLRLPHTRPLLLLRSRNHPSYRIPSNHPMLRPHLRCRVRRDPRTPTLRIRITLPPSSKNDTAR